MSCFSTEPPPAIKDPRLINPPPPWTDDEINNVVKRHGVDRKALANALAWLSYLAVEAGQDGDKLWDLDIWRAHVNLVLTRSGAVDGDDARIGLYGETPFISRAGTVYLNEP